MTPFLKATGVMMKRWAALTGAVLAVMVASGAAWARVEQSAPLPAAMTQAQLRVVTANLDFHRDEAARRDWNTIGPEADIVFLQEVKYVRMRDILGDGWAVRQDTSSEDRQGSAVVIRKSAVKQIGELHLVKGVDASPCPEGGIMTRWIARVDVQLHNNRWMRLASLHMPPLRCQTGPDSPYARMADSVVAFANRSDKLLVLGADWNKVVDSDPNDIGARTGLKPRGPDTGLRIDGFYVSPAISTQGLQFLPQTGDNSHRPVKMNITVPAP